MRFLTPAPQVTPFVSSYNNNNMGVLGPIFQQLVVVLDLKVGEGRSSMFIKLPCNHASSSHFQTFSNVKTVRESQPSACGGETLSLGALRVYCGMLLACAVKRFEAH